jgi:hypothetical protein
MAKKAAKDEAGSKPSAKQPNLDDVVIALQKSFSRVSARSASVPPENARAMVVGQVKFDMTIRTNLEEGDKLRADPGGAIELKFSGTLDTDVRTVEVETPKKGSPNP